MTAQGPARDRFGLVGASLEGRFAVERVVDEGGFGVVYRAEHLSLGVPVALKVLKLPGELDALGRAEFVETFRSEARAVARLRHPNIVRVYDSGVSTMPSGESAPWIALEWAEGATLAALCEAGRSADGATGGPTLLPSQALAVVGPLLDALAHAHAEGVAHRDLKPSNVMLVPGREAATLRVLDFGIAKLMARGEGPGSGHTRTASGRSAFSPMYAAPEQLTGTRTGPWTDVHALALIVTELLTGRDPVPADQLTEVVRLRLSPERPTPARVGLDVGPWEPVLERAMALAPGERFPDAGALRDALAATVAGADAAVLAARRGYTPGEGGFAARGGAGAAPVGSAGAPWPPRGPSVPPPTREQPMVYVPVAPTLRGPAAVPADPSRRAGVGRALAAAVLVAVVALFGIGVVRGVLAHRAERTPPPPTRVPAPEPPSEPALPALVASPDASADAAPSRASAPVHATHATAPAAPAPRHCAVQFAEPTREPLAAPTYGQGGLRVESTDPHAAVDVDGAPLALGSTTWLPRGMHRVTGQRRGCEPGSIDLRLFVRQTAVVRLEVRTAPR